MTLNPEVFDHAAELIELNGWFGGPAVRTQDKTQCPLTAVHHIYKQDNGSFSISEYVRRLCIQAGVGGSIEFIRKNDNQPDYETGKQWAISLLRETARAIREGRGIK